MGAGGGGVGTPCKDDLADGIPGRLAKVSSDYDQMLTVLHERAPKAKILAVGYPTVIPEDTSKCRYNDLEQFGPVTQGDLDWLRQDVMEPLNKAIEKSADTHRATSFVDLYDSSRNHSVCDAGKWVEGVLSNSHEVSLVHPNARGHRHAADYVTVAILNSISVD